MFKGLALGMQYINEELKQYFAKYVVVDDCNTWILCWTEKGARSWLPYCGNDARILETYDFRCLIYRKQNS